MRRHPVGQTGGDQRQPQPDAAEAQKVLAEQWDVAAELWSATSWTELARDGFECERHALRHPDQRAMIEAYHTRWGGSIEPSSRSRI